MTDSGDGDRPATSLLIECIRDPERGKQRLPAVVGLLESDDEQTRLAAAWTCCLVATAHPDTVEYVVRRLTDRLADGEVSLELTHALDYVADRYPAEVEEVLDAVADEEAAATERREIPLPETGRFTRAHYYSHTPERRGVGRVRLPSADGADDPRTTYTSGEPDDQELADRRAEAAENRESDDASAPDEADEAPGDGVASGDGADEDVADAGDSGPLARRTPDVSSIAMRSRFDQLHVLASRARGRYSEDYQALVGSAGEERAVALRLLHLPDDRGTLPEFEEALGEQLARWQSIDDHDHVVSILDWGVEPRPWLATEFAGDSLAAQDPMDAERALGAALALADAISHVHRNDVVHAGIDPENVAYPDDVLEDNDQDPPLLNNVGLMSVYRYHANPAGLLDPRYAAPEYFGREFGRIDAATDVYQLGAVVYYLFAGRPPFVGTFEEVRDAVVGPEVPVPSDVADDVPAGVDEVVSKAMATQKLTRYEATAHLHQDLLGVREEIETL